jgi:LysR family transcriptional regulator, glycine cleavage system transcriptional activator
MRSCAVGRKLPPLNALRAFEIASQATSFTAAASELCVSQGAVSRHIAHLEDYFGVPLFDRGGRQVRLTDAGILLADELHMAFDRIEAATRKVGRQRQRQCIRLGLFPTMATSWLMPRLVEFQATHPAMELQVTCKTEFSAEDKARFDVISGRGPVSESTMEYQPILDIMLRPVCSPSMLASLQTPDDLRRCTTLHSINRRSDWDAWLAKANVGPLDGSRVLRFENSVLAHQAAASGLGVAMAIYQNDAIGLSPQLVEPFPQTVRTGESYGLFWPRALSDVPAFCTFSDWLREGLAQRTRSVGMTNGHRLDDLISLPTVP